ncbi:MAG: hypothetical protein LCH79_10895 [Proteobacteria bacterium]|jgi:hypothetical protein|nr:hypothetical protein [Pseudomonadota bacterium]
MYLRRAPSVARRVAALLASIAGLVASSAYSATSNEVTAQRTWDYQQTADVESGDLYPAATLMSKRFADTSAKIAGVLHGYLQVGNYSKRPFEVMLTWDQPYAKEGEPKCKPGGCEVIFRLGESKTLKVVAVQRKHWSGLFVQDARPVITALEKHAGNISVQVQTLPYGAIAFQLSTLQPLQAEKLMAPKR